MVFSARAGRGEGGGGGNFIKDGSNQIVSGDLPQKIREKGYLWGNQYGFLAEKKKEGDLCSFKWAREEGRCPCHRKKEAFGNCGRDGGGEGARRDAPSHRKEEGGGKNFREGRRFKKRLRQRRISILEKKKASK